MITKNDKGVSGKLIGLILFGCCTALPMFNHIYTNSDSRLTAENANILIPPIQSNHSELQNDNSKASSSETSNVNHNGNSKESSSTHSKISSTNHDNELQETSSVMQAGSGGGISIKPNGLYFNSVTVPIEPVHPNAVVYYTTGATPPTVAEKGTIYTRPLVLKRTTVIQAADFVNGEMINHRTFMYIVRPLNAPRRVGAANRTHWFDAELCLDVKNIDLLINESTRLETELQIHYTIGYGKQPAPTLATSSSSIIIETTTGGFLTTSGGSFYKTTNAKILPRIDKTSLTVKAIVAAKNADGTFAASKPAAFKYTVTPPATPKFNIKDGFAKPGIYNAKQNVQITSLAPNLGAKTPVIGTKIVYAKLKLDTLTTDTEGPLTHNEIIYISDSCFITAFAVTAHENGGPPSKPLVGRYIINK